MQRLILLPSSSPLFVARKGNPIKILLSGSLSLSEVLLIMDSLDDRSVGLESVTTRRLGVQH